jgi:hypothetical protein
MVTSIDEICSDIAFRGLIGLVRCTTDLTTWPTTSASHGSRSLNSELVVGPDWPSAYQTGLVHHGGLASFVDSSRK